ncbi:MAG: hypothetical protein BWY78_00549 [Alphaproteobacteria bacterium ADurb.Bin438]|nr:MAG: hypothetical protein BWY78_00549 [Alphaproteobacteria bacterium ADurb.Bin438]
MPSEEDIDKIKDENEIEKSYEIIYSKRHEGVLLSLFGDVPNYSDPVFEGLWDEVVSTDPEKVFDYCLQKGIDLFDKDGRPVPPWRDIAVILLALDKGIMDIIG